MTRRPNLADVATTLSERRLTMRYVVALLIIAMLSVASHVMLCDVMRTNSGSAATINLTGRQRMLSQRIASMAGQYTLGDRTAREPLLLAISQMEAAHQRLMQDVGVDRQSAHGLPALQALYFGGATPLDTRVHDFIADARAIADTPPGAAASRAPLSRIFAASRAPLLLQLEQVVTLHQRVSEGRLSMLRQLQWLTLIVVLTTLLLEGIGIFRPMVRRVGRYTSELARLATIDPLTGALNRRSFHEQASAEVDRSARHGRPLCLMMLDVDHFKAINDTHGHPAGDAVLVELATMLRGTMRTSDLLCRFGGEEFAVLLPETTLPAASILAHRLRHDVGELCVNAEGKSLRLTVSVGLVTLIGTSLADGLAAADAALYEAKAAGRNRVVIGTPEPLEPSVVSPTCAPTAAAGAPLALTS